MSKVTVFPSGNERPHRLSFSPWFSTRSVSHLFFSFLGLCLVATHLLLQADPGNKAGYLERSKILPSRKVGARLGLNPTASRNARGRAKGQKA